MSSSNQLNDQINAAQKELKTLSDELNRRTRFTTFTGVAFLLILAGYLTYAYIWVSAEMKPRRLANKAVDVLDASMPKVRQSLQDEIGKSIPIWAEELSRQAVAAAPTIRNSLVNYSLKGTQAGVNELSTVSEAEFRKMLQDNRAEVETAFEQLAKNDNSEEVATAIEQVFEAAFSKTLDAEAHNLLQILFGLNMHIQRLENNEDLSEVAQLERRVVMLLKRMESEYSDPEILRSKLPAALNLEKSKGKE